MYTNIEKPVGDYSWAKNLAAAVTPTAFQIALTKGRDLVRPMGMDKYIELEVTHQIKSLHERIDFEREYYKKFSTDAIVHRWCKQTERFTGGYPTQDEIEEFRSKTDEIKKDISSHCEQLYKEGMKDINQWKKTNFGTEENPKISADQLAYYNANKRKLWMMNLMRDCERQTAKKVNEAILLSPDNELDNVAFFVIDEPQLKAKEAAVLESLGDDEDTVRHAPRR